MKIVLLIKNTMVSNSFPLVFNTGLIFTCLDLYDTILQISITNSYLLINYIITIRMTKFNLV